MHGVLGAVLLCVSLITVEVAAFGTFPKHIKVPISGNTHSPAVPPEDAAPAPPVVQDEEEDEGTVNSTAAHPMLRAIRCTFSNNDFSNSDVIDWRDPPPLKVEFDKAAWTDVDAWSERIKTETYGELEFSENDYTWSEVVVPHEMPLECDADAEHDHTNECRLAAVDAGAPPSSDYTFYLLPRQFCSKHDQGVAGQATASTAMFFGYSGAQADVVGQFDGLTPATPFFIFGAPF